MLKKTAIFAGALTLMLYISACAPAGAKSNQEGLSAFAAGDYKNAVYLFRQAITQKPDEAIYYSNLGDAYRCRGEYEEALKCFEQVIRLDAGLFYGYRGSALTYLDQKDYGNAVIFFDKAAEYVKPGQTAQRCDILGYRAEAKTALKDYEGALEDYRELIEADYRKRDIWQLMGDVYLKMEDISGALHCYQSCLDIENRDYTAYLKMAEKLKAAGAEEAYRVVLNAALEVTAKQPEDWCYRGRVYLELGEAQKAFAAFEESYNKGYVPAGYYLGYCYEQRGNFSEAMHLFQEQLKNDPQDAGLYNQMANCMIRQGEYDEALVLIEKGIKLAEDGLKADLQWNECICYEQKGDIDTAVRLLMEYTEQYPTDRNAQKELSFLFTR